MVRNKVKKFLAAALIVAATISVGGNLVQASVVLQEGSFVELASQSLKNGEYEVNNVTNYVDESNNTGQSMARNSVKEKSKVIVKDGVISVTTYFSEDLFPMMNNFKVSINGNDLNGKVDSGNMSITYEIPSLDSKVLMEMFIVVMGRQVSFNLSNNLDSLKLIKEYETAEKVENGNYTIKNDVKYTGTGNPETGNASARKTLKDVSDVTVKDGKYNLTLNFNESSFGFIGDINIKVDGSEVDPVIDRENAKVSFEINSLDSKIDVSVFVTMMNRYTDFETILLQDTLEKSDSDSSKDEGNDAVTGPSTGGSTGSTTGGATESNTGNTTGGATTDTKVEDEVVIIEGKLYTIKNKVTHSNPTGQAMARQYLNESSSLEEIEGKYYLTLTFTGMDYMSNHKFTINGKEVSAKATKIDNKTTKYRFQIPSLDVTIKVSTYVAPMGRNVDFDVTLLKDTKAFVKEFTVEKLPQTGGALSSDVLLGMGTAMLGAAGLLKRKKK
ncbi:MAG: NEAT domain-containing protein [Clostridium sp.]|uniref:NEAT domain-containing protein n=1 Tax=Clostridium sp. TaxID=1506 RepID=UPI0025C74116|nr:NEAT domain-containing protein [Clostridium sp.]MBS5926642.1 NEAT domain-containing protein [Clostridium sp.]